MNRCSLILLSGLLWMWTQPADAQTRVRLSAIIPGTENVQLVANGDFQAQGTVTATNTHPFPTGWTRRADMFADPGTNMTPANGGVVARALVNGGSFYWRQAYNAVRSGCTMVYGAMFDEVDEGTAMYKCAPTAAQLPAQGTFVPLNINSYNLAGDWYLRLADQAGKMLRGEIPLQSQMPFCPYAAFNNSSTS